MKRYEKFVFEAGKGIAFEVSGGTSGELIIRARNIVSNNVLSEPPTLSARKYLSAGDYARVLSVYIDKDGNKAVVPPGWTVSGVGDENTIWGKNKGLVIYRIPQEKVCNINRLIKQEKVSNINWSSEKEVANLQKTYDQFTWVPVEKLDSNGTLDGISFTEKFGRRNYRNDKFSERNFYETLTDELELQLESVKKYGGFYISRYNISKSSKGKPQSIKGVDPWVNINFNNAKKVASIVEDNEVVKSHLPFSAEYDSVLEWFIKSNARTSSEIGEDSTNWGNHDNNKNYPSRIVRTGEDGCINNIYGFAGNVAERTQEQKGSSYRVIRGGCYRDLGYIYPVANRSYDFPDSGSKYDGFRATLYIK